MWGRHFANLLIGMFTLWAIFVVVAWLLGVLIMFPFVEVETDDKHVNEHIDRHVDMPTDKQKTHTYKQAHRQTDIESD